MSGDSGEATNPPRTRVFVYGTLRRGASNHFRMAGAVFVCTGSIIGKLYQIDWFPGLILDETGDAIRGEVFEADQGLLEALDMFEGVSADESQSEYRRVKTTVSPENGGETLTADVWEWLGEVDESKRVKGGDWLAAFGNSP
jgi:gamma-glutamylcyclotransferase (GGCT)/AIG2-like uncharacterized protein YtfP